MRSSITIFIICLTSSFGFSCTFDIETFCVTTNYKTPNNVVVRGYFSESVENGMVFTRLETLKGTEERASFTVWDQSPFDCNGIFNRFASLMGAIDQEVVLSLYKIDSLTFDYDVIGDYRVPEGLWWETHNLQIVGDSITGYIYSMYDPTTMLYTDFKIKIIENKCITVSTNTPKIKPINVYPTLVQEMLSIDIDPFLEGKVEIYTMSGQKVYSSTIQTQINLGILEKGMYILTVYSDDLRFKPTKIVKI